MKITINNMQELAELVACIDFPKLAMMHPSPWFRDVAGQRIEGFHPALAEPYGTGRDAQTEAQRTQYQGQSPEPEAPQPEPGPDAATLGAPPPAAQNTGTDSAGFHWDERIHAPSRVTIADGTWRKKRNVSAEVVAQVEAEQLEAQRAAQEELASDEGPAAEVATETHALPVAEEPVAEEPVAEEPVAEEPAASLDYDHLLTEASARAEDLSGDMVAVLAASRSFTAKFGHQEFQRLKQAATPTDDGNGKSLPSMSPAERRLVQAVMEQALAEGGAQ